ncbi:MAG: hypothetical protein OXI81_13620 [Paracoccaceae bacterium]|nr:hypothetical protein [Paracoccaceae bacterium]MDE2911329.1 hypothetical protein [Paracoccaceae bacterium]
MRPRLEELIDKFLMTAVYEDTEETITHRRHQSQQFKRRGL